MSNCELILSSVHILFIELKPRSQLLPLTGSVFTTDLIEVVEGRVILGLSTLSPKVNENGVGKRNVRLLTQFLESLLTIKSKRLNSTWPLYRV